MIIENIKLKKSKRNITLSAAITFTGQKTQVMYFSTERKYKKFVTGDASPFLAAVLIPCMRTGENITIRGSIAQRLLQNIWNIMNLLVLWNPYLHAIAIHADEVKKDSNNPRHVGAFFSAGVDSFYTYLKHKKSINFLIFVNGFDIELENKSLFRKTLKNISIIARKEKVKVIPVETNVKNITEPVYLWDWIHGGALGAVALFLRNDFKKLFISSNVKKSQLFPYGTHPDLDYLWSSRNLQIVHTGNEADRLEKVLNIAKSDLALSYLHVCSDNSKGTYNCSHCGKCLRTMIQLTAANALQQTSTFKHTIDLKLVRTRYREYAYNYQFDAQSVIDILQKEQREPQLIKALQEGVKKSKKILPLSVRIIKSLANLDQKYNHRRFYMLVFSLNKSRDRNLLFKTFVSLGIIV